MSSQQQLTRSAATMAHYRDAVIHGRVDAIRPLLTPSAVLRSPLTDRVRFRGPDEIIAVAGAALGAIEGLHHLVETGDDQVRLLVTAGTVDGTPIEETVVLRFDPTGLITEITISVRPLPALVALMRAIGPRLLRADGKPQAARLVHLALGGFGTLTRAVDRAGASVARSSGENAGAGT